MSRSPSSRALLFGLLFFAGCTDDTAARKNEFLKLEAALGMVSSAGVKDRKIRLEQLEAVSVHSEEMIRLKTLCVSSYRAFENASELLDKTKKMTADAEDKVARADRKKSEGEALLPAEETEIITLGKQATDSLKTVTEQLDAAERLVKECSEQRNRIRFSL